jgi:hypothetical protein
MLSSKKERTTETTQSVGYSERKQVGGSHYQLPIQPVDYIVKNNIPYLEGNVIKYVTRHRNKNGVDDIDKAIHYLEIIKEMYYEH